MYKSKLSLTDSSVKNKKPLQQINAIKVFLLNSPSSQECDIFVRVMNTSPID